MLSEDDELYKNKEQFGESLETEFIEKEEVFRTAKIGRKNFFIVPNPPTAVFF